MASRWHAQPTSVACQQRRNPDPRPPQAARALRIALLGAHMENMCPDGALEDGSANREILR